MKRKTPRMKANTYVAKQPCSNGARFAGAKFYGGWQMFYAWLAGYRAAMRERRTAVRDARSEG